MAITNFTAGGKQTVEFLQLICSASLTGGIHKQLTNILGINIFLAVSAFLGNALILVALRKESSLHPPSKLLLSCLAATDLCVGLITEPLYVTHLMSLVHEKWNLCRYLLDSFLIAGYTLSSVSLLTMTAVSVDRLLALLLGLRYRQVVTLKRTYVIVATFWVVATVAAMLYLRNHLITFWYGYLVISLCEVISIFSYSKIFLILRRQQTQQVQNHLQQQQQQQPSQAIPLNIARYRKAVSSALWVQLALVVCYLPYGVVSAWFKNARQTPSDFLAWELTITLVHLNSSLNPLLYCWKISEVKQAVKQTIRDALCCL